jgi:type IV pilus assembly protein PilA
MRERLSLLREDRGFTLIEILVVILIIGILAAIAIPMFLNQKGKGEDVIAKHTAGAVTRAMQVYYTDHSTFACAPTCVSDVQVYDDGIPTNGVILSAFGSPTGNPNSNAFRVTVTTLSGREYWIDKNIDTGAYVRGCAVNGAPNQGGCNNSSW